MATILIIDDESSIVEVLTELLSIEGHQIVTASDGLAGLDILRQGLIPQLIILDLFLPRISGRNFIEQIRLDLQFQEVPILLMTGAIPEQSDLPPRESFQGIIHKPFNLIDIIEKIDQLLSSVTV